MANGINRATSVRELFALCQQQAEADYIGEAISQLEHMAQAAKLAEQEGADDELVLAAFLHDVGHFCQPLQTHTRMAENGRQGHEQVGAHWLRSLGFPQRLCDLVASHVDAKRYLCAREPGYFEALSPASRQTLVWQGGPMNAEQAVAFERDPLFADALRLRRWDEAAKVVGKPLPDLARWECTAARLLDAVS
ncbi:phosphonate degradation associated HDIG domain protein [Pseudomonas sp. TE3786]